MSFSQVELLHISRLGMISFSFLYRSSIYFSFFGEIIKFIINLDIFLVFDFFLKGFLRLLINPWSYALLFSKGDVEAKCSLLLWFKDNDRDVANKIIMYLFYLPRVFGLWVFIYAWFLYYCYFSYFRIIYSFQPSYEEFEDGFEEFEDGFGCNGSYSFNING